MNDVVHDLDEEGEPEDAEHHEQESNERTVGLVRALVPLGHHDVGQQQEVQREACAVQGSGGEAT
ncbi:MAG: hypothetical protein ABSC34_12005 [Acidimicrobiales bacterium]